MKNLTGQYNVVTEMFELEYFSFMHMADYELVLLPWSLVSMATPAFYEYGCLSNTVAMATFMRFLHKVIANLIDYICYYALRMN